MSSSTPIAPSWIAAHVHGLNRFVGFNPYATAPRWLAARDTAAYNMRGPRNEREANAALAPMGWRTVGA